MSLTSVRPEGWIGPVRISWPLFIDAKRFAVHVPHVSGVSPEDKQIADRTKRVGVGNNPKLLREEIDPHPVLSRDLEIDMVRTLRPWPSGTPTILQSAIGMEALGRR